MCSGHSDPTSNAAARNQSSVPTSVYSHAPTDVEAEVSPSTPSQHVSKASKSADTASEFSDYESIASSTTSVSSSIFHYEYENGRRYHAYRSGKYLLPNDEAELDRLDMTHHVFRLALGGELCITKLENPSRILDVGTGTGIWAMEMGDMFPATEIIGTDLSPVQPEWVPPNVHFEIDDASDQWTFPPDHFDFIHARMLGGSMFFDWPVFLSQCYRHLKPGGKLEVSEGRANFWFAHDTVPEDSFTYKWMMEWRRLAAQVQFDIFPALPEMASKVPFEGLNVEERVCPLGTWPKDRNLKELGRFFWLQFVDSGLEAYTLALFTRVGGWSEMETKVLLANVNHELRQNRMHIYTFCSFLTAQKPLDAYEDPNS